MDWHKVNYKAIDESSLNGITQELNDLIHQEMDPSCSYKFAFARALREYHLVMQHEVYGQSYARILAVFRPNDFNEYSRVGSGGTKYAWAFSKDYQFDPFTQYLKFTIAYVGMYNDGYTDLDAIKIIKDNLKIQNDVFSEIAKCKFNDAAGDDNG